MSTESMKKLDVSVLTKVNYFGQVTKDVQQVYRFTSVISGYRGPRRPGVVNPCSHSKTWFTPSALSYTTGNTVTSKVRVSGRAPISSSQINSYIPYVVANVSSSITPSEAAALMAELAGEIPPVVSVPNLLLELPQTLNLWHDLKRPLLELFSSPTARKKWRAGSSALLSQQFGFFPLIGDIRKLITSKRTVHNELQRILKQQSTSKMKKTVRRVNAVGAIDLAATSSGYSKKAGSERIEASASLHALTRIRRYLDVGDPAVASAMGRSLYGWDRPLDTLWEATPFSFVADWFLPVGAYLHGLNQSMFAGRMEIVSASTTCKMTASAEVQTSYLEDYVTKTSGCGVINAISFTRTPGIPTLPPWDDLTIPNVKQAILGGALFLQR